MQNLAGHRDADVIVVEELTRCGIELVKGELSKGEVPTYHTGRLTEWLADLTERLAEAKAEEVAE